MEVLLLPPWIPLLIGLWVIAFGVFRFYLAFKLSKPIPENRPNFRRKGYYARKPRTHVLFGIGYIVLGAYCLAMAGGYSLSFLGSKDKAQGEPQSLTVGD